MHDALVIPWYDRTVIQASRGLIRNVWMMKMRFWEYTAVFHIISAAFAAAKTTYDFKPICSPNSHAKAKTISVVALGSTTAIFSFL